MAYEVSAGGGSGYYSNPVNVESDYNSDDEGWFYPDEDNAQAWYENLVNNPVQWYGGTVDIEAEPIDNDYSSGSGSNNNDYYAPTQETQEEDYYDYTPTKSEAQKPVAAPEPEQPELEVTTVEEPKMGYTWTEVQPAAQPEQASVDQGFVTRMQNSVGQEEDQSKFYTGNPVTMQQEEPQGRSFMDRVMSIGTTPVYGESQAGPVAQPLNLPLSNMQAMQYGIDQSMALADRYNLVPTGQPATPAVPSATPNNPLSAAGAPNLFQGGSYLPGRRITLTERPLPQTPMAAMAPLATGQTPVNGLPEIQMRDYGYRNIPTINTELPEAEVSPVPVNYYGPENHLLGAGPMEPSEAMTNPVNRTTPAPHTLGAGPHDQTFPGTVVADELMPNMTWNDYFTRNAPTGNPLDNNMSPAFIPGTNQPWTELQQSILESIPEGTSPEVRDYMIRQGTERYNQLMAQQTMKNEFSQNLPADWTPEQRQAYVDNHTGPDGNLQFDITAALNGWLPDEVAVPSTDAVGRYNPALQYILTPIPEYNPDGSIKTDKDGNQVVHYPFNSPADILHLWEKVNIYNPETGPISYTQNGEGFRGLSEAVLNDPLINKFLATSPYGSILQSVIPDGSKSPEKVKATYEEYMQAVDRFIIKMPALQQLINNNLLTKEDIARFFFKGLDPVKEEKEKTTKKSGGGGGGRGSSSSSGRRGGGGGGYGSSGGTTNPPVANQKMSRIFNIMKNWSF